MPLLLELIVPFSLLSAAVSQIKHEEGQICGCLNYSFHLSAAVSVEEYSSDLVLSNPQTTEGSFAQVNEIMVNKPWEAVACSLRFPRFAAGAAPEWGMSLDRRIPAMLSTRRPAPAERARA